MRVTTFAGIGRIGQLAIAEKLTAGQSPNGAIASSVMQRPRWTAHSSFCSSRIAPTLSLDTAYCFFGGEVGAPPRYAAFPIPAVTNFRR